jgi:hypothetical protein
MSDFNFRPTFDTIDAFPRECIMIATFDRSGVRFQYPSNWTLDVETDGDGWTAIVQSPETAFVLVGLRPDADAAAELADEVLDTLRTEYEEIETEDVVVPFAGRPAIGHDVDFLTLDTAVNCRTRCVDTANGPLVVMCQVSHYDRDKNEAVLQAIEASFQIADE